MAYDSKEEKDILLLITHSINLVKCARQWRGLYSRAGKKDRK